MVSSFLFVLLSEAKEILISLSHHYYLLILEMNFEVIDPIN
jgi:hypothetical protein